MENTLAYYDAELTRAVKSSIIQAPGANVIILFVRNLHNFLISSLFVSGKLFQPSLTNTKA
jgi:hypothetical protein